MSASPFCGRAMNGLMNRQFAWVLIPCHYEWVSTWLLHLQKMSSSVGCFFLKYTELPFTASNRAAPKRGCSWWLNVMTCLIKEMGTVVFAAWLNTYYLMSFKLKFSEELLNGVAEWWFFSKHKPLFCLIIGSLIF